MLGPDRGSLPYLVDATNHVLVMTKRDLLRKVVVDCQKRVMSRL
jgi:hypothetical protein